MQISIVFLSTNQSNTQNHQLLENIYFGQNTKARLKHSNNTKTNRRTIQGLEDSPKSKVQ